MTGPPALARQWLALFGSPQSLRARLARNTLWSVTGAVLSQGSALAAAVLLGRMLGVSRFGQIAFVQTTILLLGTIGEMGLGLTVTKFTARWRAREPARAGRLIGAALRITLFSGLLMSVLLGGVGFAAFRHAVPPAAFLLGGMLLLFDMLNRIQTSALSGLEAFETSARLNVCRGALLLPCAAAGGWAGGVAGAVAGFGLGSAGTFLFGQYLLAARCGLSGVAVDWRAPLERGVLATSLSLWTGALLQAGSNWVITLLIARPPAGMTQLGLFNAAEKWRAALAFLPNLLFQVTLPMLAHSHAAREIAACRRIVAAAFASTLAVTGAGAIGVAAASGPLMASYGAGFAAGKNVLVLTAFGTVASALYTVGSGVLWAVGKPARMLAIDVLKTGLLVSLCAAGFAASAWHAALASLISFGAAATVLLWFVNRTLAEAQQ